MDFKYINISRLNVNGWKKTCHAYTNEKKSGVAILISKKGNFRARNITEDKKVFS